MNLILILLAITLVNSIPVYAGQWKQTDYGWRYEENDVALSNGWFVINGNWYYFDEFGRMASDEMVDGYYVDKDGAWDGKEAVIEQNKTLNDNEKSIFETMPKDFIFTSGVGNWSTYIEIADDGTFVGQYMDEDMGFFSDEYPNGTIYICDFNGKFSKPQQLDEYTYSTELENITTNGIPGQFYYKDGFKYIYSEPYGFDDAKTFMIYLPGTPIEHLPDGFRRYLFTYIGGDHKNLPADFYGLYNINAEEGFGGWLEDVVSETSNISSKVPQTIDLDYLTRYYWYSDCGDYNKYQFNKDGTYIRYDAYGNKYMEEDRYSLENNVLTFHRAWGDVSLVYVDKSAIDEVFPFLPDGEKVFYMFAGGLYEYIGNTYEEVQSLNQN